MLSEDGQMERAIGELQVAKRFRSTQADVYVELGRAYFKIGEIEAGMAEMKEALLVQPDQPNALVVLARYKIDQGDAAAARQWFRRVRLQTQIDRKDVELVLREFQERFGQGPCNCLAGFLPGHTTTFVLIFVSDPVGTPLRDWQSIGRPFV
jgi:tetratricopeptide (TPR) repeat protein